MANTIILKGTPQFREGKASGAITPGHLIEKTSAAIDTVQIHSSAGGAAPERAFAHEDDLQGNDIDDAYSTGNIVLYGIYRPGDEVNAILANGENVTKGDNLESNGDGTLRAVDTDTSALTVGIQSIVGEAAESVNMSDSSAADPSGRIRVIIKG